jgi:hypothetical protein
MSADSSTFAKGFSGRRADIMPCCPRPVTFEKVLGEQAFPVRLFAVPALNYRPAEFFHLLSECRELRPNAISFFTARCLRPINIFELFVP